MARTLEKEQYIDYLHLHDFEKDVRFLSVKPNVVHFIESICLILVVIKCIICEAWRNAESTAYSVPKKVFEEDCLHACQNGFEKAV